ncbi:hypothetical protein DEH81_06425 [Pectobacterium zantedeschiae]|nr:hypothetical protein DEH81_06425 [Pectobacterium zantedeschiae]
MDRACVLAALIVLREKGPMLPRPYADTVKGSRYSNMKELRIQSRGVPIRAFFAFDPHRRGIMLLNIHLAELRERVQKTQVEMAQTLGLKQPTVAVMEKPGRDLKLSTLKRYVEATGSKLRLDVELPDGSHYEFML